MKGKIINLLGVRSIITILLTVGLLYGFIVGKIEPKDFLIYVSTVYAFYFAKTGQEEAKKDIEEKIEIKKISNNEKGVG